MLCLKLSTTPLRIRRKGPTIQMHIGRTGCWWISWMDQGSDKLCSRAVSSQGETVDPRAAGH
jgi:hypothetical protein